MISFREQIFLLRESMYTTIRKLVREYGGQNCEMKLEEVYRTDFGTIHTLTLDAMLDEDKYEFSYSNLTLDELADLVDEINKRIKF